MTEPQPLIGPTLETIWRFLRGDMKVDEFEPWAYSDPTLEGLLGETLYLELLSLDFLDPYAVCQIKQALARYARRLSPLNCLCMELADTAVVDIGEESQAVFHSLKEVKKRGEPIWWLSVDRCRECAQWWLVAADTRHYDVFYLRRLAPQTAAKIVDQDDWPADFDKYENLLRLGYDAGKRAGYCDPLTSSLWATIADLARERPGIEIGEIAQLLGIKPDLAKILADKAIEKEGVQIDFNYREKMAIR